jgi:hypothetical protein
MFNKVRVVMTLLTLLLGVSLLQESAMVSAFNDDAAIPEEAKIVSQGEYDIIVLSENMEAALGKEAHALFTKEYGKRVLTWTVKEKSRVDYIYAYPYEVDARTQEPNSKTKSVRSSFETLIEKAGPWMCNVLTKDYLWSGKHFWMCAHEGSGQRAYDRLDAHGFDNVASSFYESRPSGGVTIYDCYHFYCRIGNINSDWGWFNSTFNNKASSVVAFF